MANYHDKNGFWRISCPETTKDADSWIEAKKTLGDNLCQHPSSYHWMAFGWLDEDNDFIPKESTFIEIT